MARSRRGAPLRSPTPSSRRPRCPARAAAARSRASSSPSARSATRAGSRRTPRRSRGSDRAACARCRRRSACLRRRRSTPGSRRRRRDRARVRQVGGRSRLGRRAGPRDTLFYPTRMTPEPADDIETLIQRCLQGDQLAWEQIVRQYWRKEFNVAYKFVGKHDQAEDLTQDIFLKIFKSLDTFDRRANFQTWLISISRNLCIDHYRSVRKERETIDRDVDANELSPASPDRGPF